MYYWNILELESKKEMITKKMVQEKYQEVRKRLTETYSPHDKKFQDSMNLLNMAYKYCNNDMSIAIRNNIVKNSERPNAELKVEYVKEESAKILGKRKDIREIDFLKNEKIVGELKKAGMSFNQLVPPEQKEESLFYDFETGQILSSRDTETSILLAKVNNSVRDQEFQIEKVAIYNIADPKTAITDNGSNSYARAGQLTQYNLIKSNLNSITKELITLYGEIDLDRFEKDREYTATVYKAIERARAENNPYIGTVEMNKIKEDGLEKSASKQLRRLELGITGVSQEKDGEREER